MVTYIPIVPELRKLRQDLDFMVNLGFKEIRSRQTKKYIYIYKKYKQKICQMFMYTHINTHIHIYSTYIHGQFKLTDILNIYLKGYKVSHIS